jgi:hypothetical protein
MVHWSPSDNEMWERKRADRLQEPEGVMRNRVRLLVRLVLTSGVFRPLSKVLEKI